MFNSLTFPLALVVLAGEEESITSFGGSKDVRNEYS